ncbi:MAG: heat-inducible transcriptional repressor HrcA [Actinomycetota bacterium]|nr:heat-inducible transcriptional repressor HrcA [Actinomycetota bacterium]
MKESGERPAGVLVSPSAPSGSGRRSLDRRKGSILRAIVREYVRTGQPVASKTLVERYRLQVSAATIRNDMGVLEELGYIVQPHTSAGRIPTDAGYRWFVDNWPGPSWPNLSAEARKAIDAIVASEFRGLEHTLESTSHLLSQLTENAALAIAPPSRKNVLRRVELIPRDARRATMLLIARSGEVEQGIVEFVTDKSDDDIDALSRRLNMQLAGVEFEDLSDRIGVIDPANADFSRVADEIDSVMAARATERIFRGGTANILSRGAFSDLETVHEIVDALEHPLVLSGLMNAARDSATVVVFIGHEVPVEQMRACAVIFAPYEVGGERRGTLGVVGPTRMDYPHTIAAVEAVARRLSSFLEAAG